MDFDGAISQIDRVIKNLEIPVQLKSTPILEQKAEVVGEDWNIQFINGSSDANYLGLRTLKLDLQRGLGMEPEIIPLFVSNITEARKLLEHIVSKLPENASIDFDPDRIKENRFASDAPVGVVIVRRPIFRFS